MTFTNAWVTHETLMLSDNEGNKYTIDNDNLLRLFNDNIAYFRSTMQRKNFKIEVMANGENRA